MNSYNLKDITDCQACGKYVMDGACIYLSSVPCIHRGEAPEYICKKWAQRNVLRTAIRPEKLNSNADTKVD